MSAALDLRTALELPGDADEKAIARAYRRKVRSLHPDTNPDPAAATELAALNAAYAAHNRGDAPAATPPPPASAATASTVAGPTSQSESIQVAPSPGAGRGDTIIARLHLPTPVGPGGWPYAIRAQQGQACGACRGTGADMSAPLSRCPTCDGLQMNPVTGIACADCAGSGQRPGGRCPMCGGARVVEFTHEVVVTLPEGAGRDGFARHPFPRQGFPSPTGGQPGDLVVNVTVDHQPAAAPASASAPPTAARPVGNHASVPETAGPASSVEFLPSAAGAGLVVPFTYAELRCGVTISVPTPTGNKAPLTVPPGTAPGTVLELAGHGGPLPSGAPGVLFVRCDLAWPGAALLTEGPALEALQATEQAVRPGVRTFLD